MLKKKGERAIFKHKYMNKVNNKTHTAQSEQIKTQITVACFFVVVCFKITILEDSSNV